MHRRVRPGLDKYDSMCALKTECETVSTLLLLTTPPRKCPEKGMERMKIR